MDQEARDSRKITFRCPGCGIRLTVCEALAGKQDQCPQCGRMVPVPAANAGDTTAGTVSGPNVATAQSPLHDSQFLDIPPCPSTNGSEEETRQRLQMLHGVSPSEEEGEVPRRTLPWAIDIFLYPTNKPGLTVLLICVGIPFLLRVVVRFFFIFMAAFPPMLVFWVLSIVLHWGVFAVLLLYMNWYFCECIRDSAAGGIRAADTTGTTPGLGEILGQAMRVTVSAAACMAPALIYLNETRSIDRTFWTLFGGGGFLIPMALLAVVMFDGLHGLNPAVVLGSILKTFIQYCVLAAYCWVSCLLVPLTGYCLVKQWILGSILLLLTYYQLLILAHLLGWFYRGNDEKLQWGA